MYFRTVKSTFFRFRAHLIVDTELIEETTARESDISNIAIKHFFLWFSICGWFFPATYISRFCVCLMVDIGSDQETMN